jgi:hypothetical protein
MNSSKKEFRSYRSCKIERQYVVPVVVIVRMRHFFIL